MSAETFAWIMSAIIGVCVGALITGIINTNYYEAEQFKAINELRFKCVEMREMPLGACSKLFGEK